VCLWMFCFWLILMTELWLFRPKATQLELLTCISELELSFWPPILFFILLVFYFWFSFLLKQFLVILRKLWMKSLIRALCRSESPHLSRLQTFHRTSQRCQTWAFLVHRFFDFEARLSIISIIHLKWSYYGLEYL